uniref:Uncharacterized protein n=1 Tax=Peronospora matthiolae TaxID=2874970 RepID=A0AAV1UL06_9STRA
MAVFAKRFRLSRGLGVHLSYHIQATTNSSTDVCRRQSVSVHGAEREIENEQ